MAESGSSECFTLPFCKDEWNLAYADKIEEADIVMADPPGKYRILGDERAFYQKYLDSVSDGTAPCFAWSMSKCKYAGRYYDIDMFIDVEAIRSNPLVAGFEYARALMELKETIVNESDTKSQAYMDFGDIDSTDGSMTNYVVTVNKRLKRLMNGEDLSEFYESDEHGNERLKIGAHLHTVPIIADILEKIKGEQIDIKSKLENDYPHLSGHLDTNPNKAAVVFPMARATSRKDQYDLFSYGIEWENSDGELEVVHHDMVDYDNCTVSEIDPLTPDQFIHINPIEPNYRGERSAGLKVDMASRSQVREEIKNLDSLPLSDGRKLIGRIDSDVLEAHDIVTMVSATAELRPWLSEMTPSEILILSVIRSYQRGGFMHDHTGRFLLQSVIANKFQGEKRQLPFATSLVVWTLELCENTLRPEQLTTDYNMAKIGQLMDNYQRRLSSGDKLATFDSLIGMFARYARDKQMYARLKGILSLTSEDTTSLNKIRMIVSDDTYGTYARHLMDENWQNPIVFCRYTERFYIFNHRSHPLKYKRMTTEGPRNELDYHFRDIKDRMIAMVNSRKMALFNINEPTDQEISERKILSKFVTKYDRSWSRIFDEIKHLIVTDSASWGLIRGGDTLIGLGLIDSRRDSTGYENGVLQVIKETKMPKHEYDQDGIIQTVTGPTQYSYRFVTNVNDAERLFVGRTMAMILDEDYDLENDPCAVEIDRACCEVFGSRRVLEAFYRRLSIILNFPEKASSVRLCELWNGYGANGKSMIISLISSLVNAHLNGDGLSYGATMNADHIMHGAEKTHSEGIVHIGDSRILLMQEPTQRAGKHSEGGVVRLNGKPIKDLIGSEGKFRARGIFMKEGEIRCSPSIILALNAEVELDDRTSGVRRRLIGQLFKSKFLSPEKIAARPELLSEPRTYRADPTLMQKAQRPEYVKAFGQILFKRFKEFIELGCPDSYLSCPQELYDNVNLILRDTPLDALISRAVVVDSKIDEIHDFDKFLVSIREVCLQCKQNISIASIKTTISNMGSAIKFFRRNDPEQQSIGSSELVGFRPHELYVTHVTLDESEIGAIRLEYSGSI